MNKSLHPENNCQPNFCQLFIIDPDEALQARLSRNSYLESSILTSLDNIIREKNIFAQSFMMMKEVIEIQE